MTAASLILRHPCSFLKSRYWGQRTLGGGACNEDSNKTIFLEKGAEEVFEGTPDRNVQPHSQSQVFIEELCNLIHSRALVCKQKVW